MMKYSYLIIGLVILGFVLFQSFKGPERRFGGEDLDYESVHSLEEFKWSELGSTVYMRSCASCHGSHGQGRPGYPSLQGLGEVARLEGGRDYVANVVLYGLQREGARAAMPGMPGHPNSRLAAVLNHVLTNLVEGPVESDMLFIPSDFEALRDNVLTPEEVGALRPSGLGLE